MVLSGVFFIVRVLRARDRGSGTPGGASADAAASGADSKKEADALRADIEKLTEEELQIDDYIRRMQDMLRELSEHKDNSELAYVTHDDVRKLPLFQGETLIGEFESL